MKRVYTLEAKSDSDAMDFLLDMCPTENSFMVRSNKTHITVEDVTPSAIRDVFVKACAQKHNISVEMVMVK